MIFIYRKTLYLQFQILFTKAWTLNSQAQARLLTLNSMYSLNRGHSLGPRHQAQASEPRTYTQARTLTL